jgi:ornithine cyclodeaminase/alanine dehydrogenase
LVLVLSRSDVEKVLTMKETILVLERAFRELTSGTAQTPPRASLSLPGDGWLGAMPAYLGGLGSLSTKVVTVHERNASKGLPTVRATIVLNDPATGEALAFMEGSLVTAYRTGAMGGLAAKHLSRKDSKVVGIFGAGIQARTQLAALAEVRELERVKVYDPVSEKAGAFAEEMGRKIGVAVEVSPSSSDAVSGSDIVVTATTSKVPLFDWGLVAPGTHINAFGSFRPDQREVDSKTVEESRVIVDSREAALAEAGDLIIPIKEGKISADHIVADLGEVVSGTKLGRRSEDDITLFKSVGLGIQDCAAAWLAYTKAKENGVGTMLELG